MPKEKVIYTCGVCGKEYPTFREADICERIKFEPKFSVGDIVTIQGKNYGWSNAGQATIHKALHEHDAALREPLEVACFERKLPSSKPRTPSCALVYRKLLPWRPGRNR